MTDNILVTGGAGFIGSHVTDELLNEGNNVVVLDDLSGGFVENVNERATFIEGSILDTVLLKDLFAKYKFDYVFHIAAYAAEGLSHFIKRFNYNNNLIGSINLINESVLNNVKCFVFTSSIAVYGKGQLPMNEEMTPVPEDSYGIAKLAVEQDLQASKEMFGLDYVIFRPHNVYGKRQNIGDKYRNVIGIFMNNIMQDKPITIFGDGMQTRAFSYISTVAPVIARSIRNPSSYGEVFNIGADKPYNINELVEVISNVFKVQPKIDNLKARNEVVHAFGDHSKVNKFFGASEDVPLDEGINIMAEWAQEVGSRTSEEFQGIEIEKNLPDGWALKK